MEKKPILTSTILRLASPLPLKHIILDFASVFQKSFLFLELSVFCAICFLLVIFIVIFYYCEEEGEGRRYRKGKSCCCRGADALCLCFFCFLFFCFYNF